VSVPNASVLPDQAQYAVGVEATYSCNTGYELAGGNLQRTCIAGAIWSGDEPICQSTLSSTDSYCEIMNPASLIW